MTDDATPSMADIILDAIDSKLLDVHVAIPCRVDSYNVAAGTVDCTPVISRVIQDEDGERVVEELPRLLSVPVIFPGAGVYGLTFPINRGDYVQVQFCDAPVGEWFASEGSDPMDERRHSLAGAVAIAGIRPRSKADPNATTTRIVLGGGPVSLGTKDAAEAMILGTTLDGWLSNISSYLQQLHVAFNTHVHVETGASTNVPTTPLTPAPNTKPTIVSSQHKLDS